MDNLNKNLNGANGSANGYAANGNRKSAYADLEALLGEEDKNQETDIFKYLRAIYKGRWIILTLFIISTLIASYIASSQKNIYQSTTTFLLRTNPSTASVVVSFDAFGQSQSDKDNEITILKSRSLAEDVAIELLKVVYQNPKEKTDTLEILLNDPEKDRSIAQLQDIAARVRGGIDVKAPKLGGSSIDVSFKSYDPEEASVVSRAVVEVYRERNSKSSKRNAINLRTFLEKQLDAKRIDLKDSEDRMSRFAVDNRVVELGEESKRMIERYSEAMSKMDEVGVVINASNASLQAYREEMAALASKLPEAAVQSGIDQYTKRFQAEIAQKEVDRDKILAMRDQDNENVRKKLKAIEEEIEAYKKSLQEAYEKQVKRDFGNVGKTDYYQDLSKKTLGTQLELASAQMRFKAYQKLAEKYDQEFQRTPQKNIELARLQRSRDSNRDIVALLEKRFQEAKIAEEQIPNPVEVVDWAVPEYGPVAPKRSVIVLIGVVIGIFLGVLMVMIIQLLDRNVHTPEDAEKLGTLLATIPVIETYDETIRQKASANVNVIEGAESESRKIASHLVTHFDPKGSVSEAYRTLRTSLVFSKFSYAGSDKTEGNVYAVTSSAPKEGKSTTISNLAITLAQGGQKVLLIDCDLRRPVIHAVFGYNKEPGITNYLVGRAAIDDVIRSSSIRNLDIITSGTIPPNPSELLGTDRMKKFIEDMRQKYDTVLIDTPPVIAVTDAQVIANEVDGTLIVVSSGSTQTELAQRSKELISKVGGRVLGFVLNNFDITSTYGSYYKYYRYYNYYYESKTTPAPKKTILDRVADLVTGRKD
jgi:capsular exopolysaccharide synthesis family protein